MGNLATYLQSEFAQYLPFGWTCSAEQPVLPKDLEKRLGYSSRVDLLLEQTSSRKRIWVEFEISRADPVANHAKFATSHLFLPQGETDVFLSMVSYGVQRGRRNLAGNTVTLMRQVGMNAFQTVLLPQFPEEEIKRLNQLPLFEMEERQLDVKAEVDRAIAITEAVIQTPDRRIHWVGDLMQVFLNVRQWNLEMATDQGQELWKKRRITYFTFDPVTKEFAPSKFCAYTAILSRLFLNKIEVSQPDRGEMFMQLYVTLDGTDSRFDGRRARLHLTQGLGMEQWRLEEKPKVAKYFERWLKRYKHAINLNKEGIYFIMPPCWFK